MTRRIILPILLVLLGCSSQKTEESSDSTSVEAIDSMIETETAAETRTVSAEDMVADEEEDNTAPGDSTWLKEFTKDPLVLTAYEGIKDFLKQRNIPYQDTIINDEHWIIFGTSRISINVAEAYGDLICSAHIEDAAFPLSGIDIGMSREDFFAKSGLAAENLSNYSGGNSTFDFTVDEGDYYWTVTFYFDETTFTALDYRVSSCLIYD